MNIYVYILFSRKDNKLYFGQTKNLENRIKAHNNGKVKSTKHRRPLELIHYEIFETRSDALKRERELKSISSRDFKRLLRQKKYKG